MNTRNAIRQLLMSPCIMILAPSVHAAAVYWNLFNAEGESAADAVYVTYATLNDMLNDTNRTGSGVPDGFGAGVNVVGSGAFVIPEPPVSVPEPSVISLIMAALVLMLGSTKARSKPGLKVVRIGRS